LQKRFFSARGLRPPASASGNQYQHNLFGSSLFQLVVPRLAVKSAKIEQLGRDAGRRCGILRIFYAPTWSFAKPVGMRFGRAAVAVLLLVDWNLIAPTQAPTAGSTKATIAPTTGVWHTYKSKQACEQDRDFLRHDPLFGSVMTSAQCIPTRARDPTPP
jgi:hypothetical protein